MTFGLLTYNTTNLGDEIQSIAARRLLPRVDMLLPRDALDGVASTVPIAAVLNGWFVADAAHWPPSPIIRPLLISMHLDGRRPPRRAFWCERMAHKLTRGAGRAWLHAHGPVGARDRQTLRTLQQAGVDAWYSGCLTLTLPMATAPREDMVVLCDVPAAAATSLRQRVRTPLVEVTHFDAETCGHDARMQIAEDLLALYGRAKAVVTSRLHCALPCLALGTPVLFVPIAPDLGRQQPGIELCHTASLGALIRGQHAFDCDAPPANRTDRQALAPALEARCRAFVRAAQSGAAA